MTPCDLLRYEFLTSIHNAGITLNSNLQNLFVPIFHLHGIAEKYFPTTSNPHPPQDQYNERMASATYFTSLSCRKSKYNCGQPPQLGCCRLPSGWQSTSLERWPFVGFCPNRRSNAKIGQRSARCHGIFGEGPEHRERPCLGFVLSSEPQDFGDQTVRRVIAWSLDCKLCVKWYQASSILSFIYLYIIYLFKVLFIAARVRFTNHPKQHGVARIPGGSGQLLVESICFWEVGCRERSGWFYFLSSALLLLGPRSM